MDIRLGGLIRIQYFNMKKVLHFSLMRSSIYNPSVYNISDNWYSTIQIVGVVQKHKSYITTIQQSPYKHILPAEEEKEDMALLV